MTIGISNFWSFPYRVYVNGGGTYLYLYIIALFTIAVPILFSEFMVGSREGQLNLQQVNNKSDEFYVKSKYLGFRPYFSFIILVFIISVLSVVGSWSINYFSIAISSGFKSYFSSSDIFFINNIDNNFMLISFQISIIIFAFLVSIVTYRRELTKFNNIVFVFFILNIVSAFILIFYKFGYSVDAIKYIFTPVKALTNNNIFFRLSIVIGEVLFAMSIGTGLIISYTRHSNKRSNFMKISTFTAIMSLAISLIITLSIFTVLSNETILGNDSYDSFVNKPGLVYIAMPILFSKIPFGNLFGISFFLSLSLMAFVGLIGAFSSLFHASKLKTNLDEWKSKSLCLFVIIPIAIMCQTGLNITITIPFISSIFKTDLVNKLMLYQLYNFVLQFLLPIGIIFFCRYFNNKISKEEALKYFKTEKLFRVFKFYVGIIIPVILLFTMVTTLLSIPF